jgi:hypothetical protein
MADANTNIFQDIAAGKPAAIQPRHYLKAREWFRQAAQKVTDVRPTDLFRQMEKNTKRTINISSVGSMFLYQYDPKTKDKLPYYDTYPLAFIVDLKPGGWTGLNLHYLPPYYRAKLMNSLYDITIKEGEKMKVQMSYNLLGSARKFGLFKPCYKRYLSAHVQSRLLFIEPDKWDMAMMLPLQRFAKASEEQVWKDSRKAM